ncbi:hypothetical protein TNCV_4660491 [Trichonephila clavipes]|uniref:Uncharacterized protein n=1 Tax=Trichonephila clavipes TaxID=2585209 RepID=A0A8X6SI51_TRICX|nr:hypothetical protein TNCV_4660491 [Trichonephila clavipes]
MLPKELDQLKYEAISVPQGSARLVKKTQERKSSTCFFVGHQRCHEFEPSTTKDPSCMGEVDSVAIEVSSRPKLTGIVRGRVFLHVLRRRPIGCSDSPKRTR